MHSEIVVIVPKLPGFGRSVEGVRPPRDQSVAIQVYPNK
jgi:hypothetical protein